MCLAGGLAWTQPARAADTPPTPPVPATSTLPDGSLSGWFEITWGDSLAGESQIIYTLTDSQGTVTSLSLDESVAEASGGVLSLNNKHVVIHGRPVIQPSNRTRVSLWQVSAIDVAPGPGNLRADALPSVTGSKPWVSIMCKFSDHAEEPRNLAFFQGMYSATRPGLDHYWQELSYGIVNVTGSGAFGWFTLPYPESHYNPTDTGQGTDRDLLADDCIHVADPSVNFANYEGINMMFNTDFDNGWAWGGGRYLNLDGLTGHFWSTTWEPPWGYANISVIAHEMGHGFGMPHSSGNYGQTYDNAWDVMSQDRYNCAAATDPTYGCIAQHTIAYHLADKTGWIGAGEIYMAVPGVNPPITLEQLALPQISNYKMARIPIAGSSTHFYTVEARRRMGYDSKLAGDAVIIHEVDIYRSSPAHVIDADLDGNTSSAGAMWVVGETFTDSVNQISVYVSAATASGFQVSITTPANIWTISGRVVTSWGSGVGGVQMTGLPNHPSTNADGYYSDQVIGGWSGTVTPQKTGLAFDLPSRTYTNVASDQASQDYLVSQMKIMYVKPTAVGSANCSSWGNACLLRDASLIATGGEEIWAAAGTYTPTSGTDKNQYFRQRSGVAIFGGFDGSETSRSQRDPAAHVTILSGDIGVVGDPSDNSSMVMRGATGALLDGVTITDGNASGTSGGGMYNSGSSPLISNVIFSHNSASFGAGMYNYNSSPILTNVTFKDNSASQCGGGIYNNTSSNPIVTNASLSGNTATWGAAIFNHDSNPTLTHVTFSLNTSTYSGSGIYDDNSNPAIHNVILWGNTPATNQIYNSPGTPVISDSVVQNGYAGGANIITTNPNLGTLGNYGGSTLVIPILSGSSAIDTANNTYCPATDQRGVSRPQGPKCDIGAYERDLTPPTVISSLRTYSNPAHTPSVAFTVTFSEYVMGVSTSDFSLTTTGVTGAQVSDVSGSGNIYYVSVSTGSGDGTIRLDLPLTATITNMDGISLTGLPYTAGQTYTIERYANNLFLPFVNR